MNAGPSRQSTREEALFKEACHLIKRKYGLTDREVEVLCLLSRHGYTNGQMARQLFISEVTVKSHIASLFKKMGAKSTRKLQAIVLAELVHFFRQSSL